MTDEITFACSTCDTIITIDRNNPPNDEDILSCTGCGYEFGTFAVVKKAMMQTGKSVVNKIIRKHLGKRFDR